MLSAASPVPLALQRANPVRALSGWLRRRAGSVAMAALLAFAGPLTFFTGAVSVMPTPAPGAIVRLGLWWTAYGISLWCMLLAAGYACERLTPRCGRYAAAAIWLLAAGSAAALPSVLTAGRATVLIEQGLVHSARTMHLHGFIISLVMALLYFTHLRRSREHEQATARLAAAQAAQRHARRRIAEARLQELQARIDPHTLFEMLDTVRNLYERDAALAERFLDALIAFLRAALPRLRTASSTLVREIELARAFVGLRVLAGVARSGMAAEVAPEAIHARFPPGVLLPLVDAAAGAGSCRLAARCSDDGCRLVLTLDAVSSQGSVARVRSLLTELYGTAGKVQTEARAGAMRVLVELPYELA